MSIKADIDRGLEIRAELEKLTTELKDIEVRVKHAALHGEQIDLADADREGRQFLATGTSSIVPVVFTADKLIGSFKLNTPIHNKILAALGPKHIGMLPEFFAREVKFDNQFESGKKFRSRAGELLDTDAPAFITARVARDKDGIPKSDIKILWDDVKAKVQS